MAEKDGPVYLLSLDGGGVRGICELVILDKIMKRMQTELGLEKPPRPCEHFHLIGGVSTGGLVAIMLGRLGMSTTEAIAAYHEFAENIFGLRNRRPAFLTPLARDYLADIKVAPGKFGTKKLETIIQELVKKTGNSEQMLDEAPKGLARAFVCTQKYNDTGSGSLVMLRGYKLPKKPLSQEFLEQIHEPTEPADSTQPLLSNVQPSRPEDLQPFEDYTSCKIWEAARATSAASSFFRPMDIKDSRGQPTLFIDAALGCNNPVKYVCTEAAALFGVERKLGCVLSLGTGLVGTGLISTESGSLLNVVKAVVKHATTSETTNKEVQAFFGKDTNSYFRLNLPMEKKVKLSDWKSVRNLAKDTAAYLEGREPTAIVNHVVDILLGKHKPVLKLGQVAFADQGQFRPKKPPTGRPSTTSHFIGRQDVISRLTEILATPQLRRTSALIWANGGAGKTTTASKFLDDHDNKFDKIFWVDATNEETLAASYALIAEGEQLTASGANVTGIVLEHIASCPGHWLLVLDNVTGDVRSYLPPGNRGSLLFTSRNKDTSIPVRSSDIIELGNLGDDESVTLLLDIAGMDQTSRKNKADALQIVTTQLAYLPLAIEQAATHIRKQKITLAVYASRFEEQRRSLLSRRPLDSKTAEAAVLPGTEAVHVSFDLTYEVLIDAAHGDSPEAHEAKNALRVLSAFSFYANEGLMANIFQRAAENRPEERTKEELGGETPLSLEPLLVVDTVTKKWDMDNFRAGVYCLVQWSLVKLDDTGSIFSMHLLTHDWARERSSDRERLPRAMSARHILFDSFGVGLGEKDWIFNFRMMPHMKACLDSTGAVAQQDPINDARQRQKYAKMLCSSLRDHDAIDILANPILTCGKGEWVFSHVYWDMLETVVEALLRIGNIARAEEVIKPVLKAQEVMIHAGKLKHSDIVVLNTQAIRANLMIERGHWEEAESILRSAIDTCDSVEGEGPWTEPWLSLLESCYTSQGKFEEAYEVAWDLHRRCSTRYEPTHKKVVDSTRTLAGTCTTIGKFSEAIDLAHAVIEIEESQSQPGARVPSWLITQLILGNALVGQERWDEAYDIFTMLVEVQKEDPLADRKIEMPQTYQGLAQAALFTGRFEEGLEHWLYSFELLERQFGLETHRTIQAATHLLRWLEMAADVGIFMEGPQWDAFMEAAMKVC